MGDPRAAIDAVYRAESGRITAALIRYSGSFDLAEEALQDAVAAALTHWERDGLPANPGAWLMAASKRKLIDFIRRARTRHEKSSTLAHEINLRAESQVDDLEPGLDAYPDDRLRLIFTCCHPALNVEAQVALTLRTLGGLTTAEIARAFLRPEATIAQRLVRARNKIKEAGIPYEVPPLDQTAKRLQAVLAVVYLIFNEGYAATEGESLMRSDLGAEAIRLARILRELVPSDPEVIGLLALMLLHDSRGAARINVRGELVPLEEQDRRLWDQGRMAEGLECLDLALREQRPGPYQIQAAIAATHAHAREPGATDWTEIASLYGELLRLTPTPVVALNHAVAVAMSQGLEEGLKRIEWLGVSGTLDEYRLYHAARADLLRRLGRRDEALRAYEQALVLSTNRVEEAFLRKRVASFS